MWGPNIYMPFGGKNIFLTWHTSCICQGMEKDLSAECVKAGKHQSNNYWPKSLDISFQKGEWLYTVPKYFKKVIQKTGLKSMINVDTRTTTALINRTSTVTGSFIHITYSFHINPIP